MTSTRWSHSRSYWQVLLPVLALTVLIAVVSTAAASEPYETGPVIHDSWLVPAAPFTEGYQPYEVGPVIHDSWLAPSAPFTEGYQPYETGPVIHDSWTR